MLLLRKDKLPDSDKYLYEIKLDGYRSIAGRSGSNVILLSRNNNDFEGRFPAIAKALHTLPDETLVDGELAVLDSEGRPSLLSRERSSTSSSMCWFSRERASWNGRLMNGRCS
jgi:ATP-dependent DNA ligase